MTDNSATPPPSKPGLFGKWGCLALLAVALLLLYGLQKAGCSPLQVHESIELTK